MSAPAPIRITFGPDSIEGISRAVETLLPWLAQSRYKIRPNGALEFTDPEPAEAVRLLGTTRNPAHPCVDPGGRA